jgi:hypothetical protein
MASKKKPVATPADPAKMTFSKSKIVTFKRYSNRVDLLGALLEDEKEYTVAEVDSLVENFMKGKVK